MQYILSITTAILIVSAQSSWKHMMSSLGKISSLSDLFTKKYQIIFSPYFYLGIILYILATLLYFTLLSRFQFSVVQAIVVAGSLVISFIVASVLFKEHIMPFQYLGILLILIGVYFVGRLS